MQPTAILVLIVVLLFQNTTVADTTDPGVWRSSAIKQAAYDTTTQTLTLTFPNGAVYAYAGVPADVYAALRSATSAGIYFRAHIKTVYVTRRLQPPKAPTYGCDRMRDTRTSRMASSGARNSQP